MTARKFLSALTALTMISQITASLTAAAASSEIPGADRVVINSVTADTADFTVETDGAYTAYVAVYNTDGVLEGVRLINLTETGEVSFDEIGFSNGQTLKCMVWDENMLPAAAIYTEATEVTETETPTETATEAAEEGFVVTFETDEHASVTVYDTQDTTTGGTENASEAYARNSATGEVDISGDGQVNFVVVLDEGYEIDTITAEGGYKNLKNVSGTTYRATKITDAVTVTITTKEIVSGGETEGDGVIHLKNTSIDATGVSGAAVSGTTVTLTESAAAYDSAAAAYVYNIEGTLDDGQIVVAASNKTSEFVLNLDNVTVACSAGNALNATTGAVTLANVSGSTSTFTSTYTYTDASTGETDNGAGIYSKNDLTIKGADSSTKIVANSTYGNGIRCKADLEIGTGDIEVTAGNNGIKGDESIKLTKKAGNVTVTAVGDAMKTDAINSDTLKLDTDSTYAPKGTITVNGGTLELTSTGGDGIQADYGFISVYSPSITINSATEGIKVNTAPVDAWYYTDETQNTTATIQGYIQINGGTFNITSAEDGLKAADYVNISGGDITVVSALDGIQSGVDYTDTNGSTAYTNGNINITGGSFDIKAHGGSSGSSTTDSCKGIKAVNAVNISGGNFIINSYDDAIHSNYTVAVTGGTYEIASADDGVHADYRLSLGTEGGMDDDYTMNISTSYEGLEGSVIEYLSGTTTLYSTDDGVNAAGDYESNGTYHGTAEASTVDLQTAAGPGGNPGGGNPGGSNHGPIWGDDDTSGYGMLYIKGGKLYLRAQGDGLDSNGSILMSGGVVVVAGTTRGGNGVFDKGDASGSSFSVTGGTLIGYGTTDMQDNPTVSGQGYLSTTANLTAGSTINVQTSGGYIGIVPEYSMSRALLFVTSPDMSSGSVYSGSVSYSDSDKLVGRTVSNVCYGAYKK